MQIYLFFHNEQTFFDYFYMKNNRFFVIGW